MELVRLAKPLKYNNMPKTFEFFRENFLTFEPVFVQIGQIITMIGNGEPTYNVIQNCADIMVMQHHKIMRDPDVLRFMNLTATSPFYRSITRPFLKELIISALDQAIVKESVFESHAIFVRKDILVNSELSEEVKKEIIGKMDISDFGRRIKEEIPQIERIIIDGISSRDEFRFSMCYNPLLKAEFDPSKKKLIAI